MSNVCLIEIGKVYPTRQGGSVTVISYDGATKVTIKHNDEHGHKMVRTADAVRKGMINNPYHKSVCGIGYLGCGVYSSKNPEHKKILHIWRGMFMRCYNTKNKGNIKNYYNCTVHPDWNNFQVFAEWYCKHESYGLGYALDKDLLIKGNKVYSESTCSMLPTVINSTIAINFSRKDDYPVGVTKVASGAYVAACGTNKKRIYLGSFLTSEEASEAYVSERELQIKILAKNHKAGLGKREFEALMNWTVH